jgi:hypothetical protein
MRVTCKLHSMETAYLRSTEEGKRERELEEKQA